MDCPFFLGMFFLPVGIAFSFFVFGMWHRTLLLQDMVEYF